MLREVIVKIGLERINIQKLITVKALLNNGAIGLVISSKLKKIKKPIYMRNVNEIFNEEGLIEYTVKVIFIIKDIEREQK